MEGCVAEAAERGKGRREEDCWILIALGLDEHFLRSDVEGDCED